MALAKTVACLSQASNADFKDSIAAISSATASPDGGGQAEMLLGGQGWVWRSQGAQGAQCLRAAMHGVLKGASCFRRPERGAATCCPCRDTALRRQAGRGSVLGTSPTTDGGCSSSACLRVDVSPIDQVVHLGWEWWRVLSAGIQSLLLLNATRPFRANLPQPLLPWATSQEMHPLAGPLPSQPQQFTSKCEMLWITEVAPCTTEIIYSPSFKGCGKGGFGAQLIQRCQTGSQAPEAAALK